MAVEKAIPCYRKELKAFNQYFLHVINTIKNTYNHARIHTHRKITRKHIPNDAGRAAPGMEVAGSVRLLCRQGSTYLLIQSSEICVSTGR